MFYGNAKKYILSVNNGICARGQLYTGVRKACIKFTVLIRERITQNPSFTDRYIKNHYMHIKTTLDNISDISTVNSDTLLYYSK